MTWTTTELRDKGVGEARIALRLWRRRFDVTLVKLAAVVGINPGQLSSIERGETPLTLARAEQICAGCRTIGPPNADLGAFQLEIERMREAATDKRLGKWQES